MQEKNSAAFLCIKKIKDHIGNFEKIAAGYRYININQ